MSIAAPVTPLTIADAAVALRIGDAFQRDTRHHLAVPPAVDGVARG